MVNNYPYNKDFLDHQKEKLESELANLQAKSEVRQEVEESQEVNPEEAAGEVAEQFNTMAADIFEDKRIEEIKSALLRISDDTYGQCLKCGAWITKSRLEIVPTATRCANC